MHHITYGEPPHLCRCTSCGQGFCWICGEMIVDSHGLPPHFSTLNPTSSCAGKQFVTADGETAASPPMTPCETRWACLTGCAACCILTPFAIVFFIIFGCGTAILRILYAFCRPLCTLCRGELPLADQDSCLRCLTNSLLIVLAIIFILPPLVVLSPILVPFGLYMRCKYQAFAREQAERNAAGDEEDPISLEESQERTAAAEAAMQYELDQQALPAEQEDGSESSETHLLPLPESQERDYQTLPLLQMEHAV